MVFANAWKHPKTSIFGVLSAVVTVCGVLSSSGVSLGKLGTGTVIGVVGAVASALVGMLARDPENTAASVSGATTKAGAVLLFLAVHARVFFCASLAFGMLAVCMVATGCAGPVWVTEAEAMMPVLSAAALSVVSLVAALTGNAAAAGGVAQVTAWVQRIDAAFKIVDDLVQQYKAAPDASLIDKIKAAAQDALGMLQQQDLTVFGLPAEMQQKIAAVAAIVEQQLLAWIAILPLANLLHAAPGATVSVGTVHTPMEIKAFKATVTGALKASTGHAVTDAAGELAAAEHAGEQPAEGQKENG